MPRKVRSTKSSAASSQSQVKAPPSFEQDPDLSPIGREANGRFPRGNAGGPGNPHARHCARMLAMVRNWLDDDKMLALLQVLFDKAISGDMSALKLLFSYKVGKPGPAPEPDAIERDEWKRFEETAVQYQQIQDLLQSLPSNVANEIVRGTWPVAAGAWADNLGRQLQQAGGTEAAVASGEGQGPGEEKNPVTGAHGESKDRNEQLEKYEEFMNQQIFGAPLPNGCAAEGPTARKQTSRGNGTPIANRKSNTQPASEQSVPASPVPRRSSSATSSCAPATSHSPPTTNLPPLPNGKSKMSQSGKAKRKALNKHWLGPIAAKLSGSKSKAKKPSKVAI